MIVRLMQLGAILIGVLTVLGAIWVSDRAADYSEVECAQQTDHNELKILGLELIDTIRAGDPAESMISSAKYVGFACTEICSDGSVGSRCSPQRGERVVTRCLYIKADRVCRHSLVLRGGQIDGTLLERPESRVRSRKQPFLRTLRD